MSERIKTVRIRKGEEYTPPIPIGADAKDIDVNANRLDNVIDNINQNIEEANTEISKKQAAATAVIRQAGGGVGEPAKPVYVNNEGQASECTTSDEYKNTISNPALFTQSGAHELYEDLSNKIKVDEVIDKDSDNAIANKAVAELQTEMKNSVTKLRTDIDIELNDQLTSVNNKINILDSNYNTVFQLASNGKMLISEAITGKGIPSTSDDSFSEMALKITNLGANDKTLFGLNTDEFIRTFSVSNLDNDLIIKGKIMLNKQYCEEQGIINPKLSIEMNNFKQELPIPIQDTFFISSFEQRIPLTELHSLGASNEISCLLRYLDGEDIITDYGLFIELDFYQENEQEKIYYWNIFDYSTVYTVDNFKAQQIPYERIFITTALSRVKED